VNTIPVHKAGVLDRMFTTLQEEQVIRIKVEALSLDSTIVKVHPDGTGAEKKRCAVHRTILGRMDHQDSYGCRRCSNGGDVLPVAGSGSRRPRGTRAPENAAAARNPVALIMDRAYQGDETRQLALDLGFKPVVPPTKDRLHPWSFNRALYRRHNGIERSFRRLKGFRRIFSRFDKLDVMFTASSSTSPSSSRPYDSVHRPPSGFRAPR